MLSYNDYIEIRDWIVSKGYSIQKACRLGKYQWAVQYGEELTNKAYGTKPYRDAYLKVISFFDREEINQERDYAGLPLLPLS